MKPRTIENLQYFLGKVCSIVTVAMNRSFEENISREHFVVVIQSIDSDGIWGTHPYNHKSVSFFRLEQLISIHEEEVIDPKNPEHAAMIKEFEQRTGKKVQSDLKEPVKQPENLLNIIEKPMESSGTGDSMFVDIENLERLAEDSRRAFEQYDKFNQSSK